MKANWSKLWFEVNSLPEVVLFNQHPVLYSVFLINILEVKNYSQSIEGVVTVTELFQLKKSLFSLLDKVRNTNSSVDLLLKQVFDRNNIDLRVNVIYENELLILGFSNTEIQKIKTIKSESNLSVYLQSINKSYGMTWIDANSIVKTEQI